MDGSRSDVKQALHLLLARVHLDMANVRPLTRAEAVLARDLDRWWRSR